MFDQCGDLLSREGSAWSSVEISLNRKLLFSFCLFVCLFYLTRALIFFQDHCESVAILKIKESMQEEARRFENVDGTTDHQGEFFMQ